MSEQQAASPVIDEHTAIAERVFQNMEVLLRRGYSAGVRAKSVDDLKEKNTVACLGHIEGVQKKTMKMYNLTPAE